MTLDCELFTVDRLECRLTQFQWSFRKERAEDIRRHWEKCRQNVPSLYNGPILLARHYEVVTNRQQRILSVDFFETDFSSFIAWRDFGWPDKAVFNCFSQAAVRSLDGAFLLGEMGLDHSNPGAFYFPCGNPDLQDLKTNGAVDLRGSLIRELFEETGLVAAQGKEGDNWTIICDGQRIACLRRFDWPLTSQSLTAQIRRFLDKEAKPELANVHFFQAAAAAQLARAPDFIKSYLSVSFDALDGMKFPRVQCKLSAMTRSVSTAHASTGPIDARVSAILSGLAGRIIVLVGMMGSGKTAIGQRLASRLGLPFVDADAEIVAAAGMSIQEIFAKYGEAYFRDGERRVIMRLLNGEQIVLATGGGAFMDQRTRERIAERGVSIWLDADVKTLMKRVRRKNDRPLLHTENPEETLRQLMDARTPIYRLADICVPSHDAPQDVMVEETLGALVEGVASLQKTQPTQKKDSTQPMAHLYPHRSTRDTSDAAHRETVAVGLDGRGYDIVIGANLLEEAGARIAEIAPEATCAIVTDENVARLHLATLEKSLLAAGMRFTTIVIPPGESSKSLSIYGNVCDEVLAAKIERRDLIIAFGGGVVGDLAGFVAASVRRGSRFVQIPTTLLSQVDSSVGGKTGINSAYGKNLIGAFHQPSLVLADVDVLRTLAPREFRAGYAEVVKYGLIGDTRFFDWLDADVEAVFHSRAEQICAVAVSCETKAALVAKDELEQGDRALLNLGHTFGHALELLTKYDSARLVHGEGVAIGMVCAARFSVQLGLCSQDTAERIVRHLDRVGLPTKITHIPGWNHGAQSILEAMYQDKKVVGGALTFILLRGIGQSFIARGVDPNETLAFLEAELTRA